MELLAKRNTKNETQTIDEHGKHSLKIYKKLNEIYDLDLKFENIITSCNSRVTKYHFTIIMELIANAIESHDIGKSNCHFQKKIRGIKTDGDSSHSSYSALLYLIRQINMIDLLQIKRKKILKSVAIRLSYLISKHHSILDDFDTDIYFGLFRNFDNEKLNLSENDIQDAIEGNVFNENIYIFDRLVFSILTVADVVSSYEFESGEDFKFNNINVDDVANFKNTFENNNIVKSIRREEYSTTMNKTRGEIFTKAESRISNETLTFLEAQTGSGKTITSMGLINKVLENRTYKRVIYTAPFKTILFQTEGVISDMLTDTYMIKNEDTEIYVDVDDLNYDRDVLNDNLLNNNVVITSHVKLFNLLFSTKKTDVMGLYGLMDSVIVLDEIQAYNNAKWINIINMLAKYGKMLNIHFIIMSATLPKLDKLLLFEVECKYLFSDSEVGVYREFFNKRVDTNFDILKSNIVYDNYEIRESNVLRDIGDRIIKHNDSKKFLIGLISSKTSYRFYEYFKQAFASKGYKVMLLNSDTPKQTRSNIINTIKSEDNSNIILIATQVIEAGVDIDMDIGFKDYGILDGDIQFKGRIARNFTKRGLLYVFDLDDYKNIYRSDLRKRYTLGDYEGQQMFISEDFNEMYNANFEILKHRDNYLQILKICKGMQFSTMSKEMQLINQESVNILIKDDTSNKIYLELKDAMTTQGFGKRKVSVKKKMIELSPYIIHYNLYNNDKNITLEYNEKTRLYELDECQAIKYIENSDFGRIVYTNKLREDMSGLFI